MIAIVNKGPKRVCIGIVASISQLQVFVVEYFGLTEKVIFMEISVK